MAHPELDTIFDEMLTQSQDLLRKYGEFFPFGRTMSTAGEITHVNAIPDNSDRPPSQDVIDLLEQAYQEQIRNGEIRAAAISLDVRVVPPGQEKEADAICVRLAHENGEAVDVFQTYRKGLLGRVKFGDIFAMKGRLLVFQAPPQ